MIETPPMALLNSNYKEYKLYDLSDTTSLDFYAPSAVHGIVKICSLKEYGDVNVNSTMTYYLTVTNEMLEGMRKDYSMLETFCDYYNPTPTE